MDSHTWWEFFPRTLHRGIMTEVRTMFLAANRIPESRLFVPALNRVHIQAAQLLSHRRYRISKVWCAGTRGRRNEPLKSEFAVPAICLAVTLILICICAVGCLGRFERHSA